MWGAIIKAIDHAMGRFQKGMSAGIDVAGNQHGGASGMNAVGGSGDAGSSIAEASKESEAGAKESSNIDIGDNTTSTGEESGGSSGGNGGLLGGGLRNVASGAMGGAGGVGDIGGEDAGGGEGAEGMAEGAGEMLSDESAKESKEVSSGKDGDKKSTYQKFKDFMGREGTQTALNYSTNLSKGIANAGAIATGKKASFDMDNSAWSKIGDSIKSDKKEEEKK